MTTENQQPKIWHAATHTLRGDYIFCPATQEYVHLGLKINGPIKQYIPEEQLPVPTPFDPDFRTRLLEGRNRLVEFQDAFYRFVNTSAPFYLVNAVNVVDRIKYPKEVPQEVRQVLESV